MGWLNRDLGGKVGMDHIDHMDGRGDMSDLGGVGDLSGVGDIGSSGFMSGKDLGGMVTIVRLGIIGGMILS